MAIGEYYLKRTAAAVKAMEAGLGRIMFGWTILMSVACAARLAFAATPIRGFSEYAELGLLYALVIAAPIISALLALRWFAAADEMPQPRTRLARLGCWRHVTRDDARSMRDFGTHGIMFSLLVGMLLNIPVRSAEFLVAVPAAGSDTPGWYPPLFHLMLADVVLFSSAYAVAFVAALRHVPLFPRLLVTIWGVDLAMQMQIAKYMSGIADLPVAVAGGLSALLEGNVSKILISVALWLPYLLLSRRVNLTYRGRVPA